MTVRAVLTVAEVAAGLKVSQKTVLRAIHNGDLVAHRVGRCFRICEGDLEAWFDRGRFVAQPLEAVTIAILPEQGSRAALRRIEMGAA